MVIKKYFLRLYVAGDVSQIEDVIKSLKSLLRIKLEDEFQLQAVDVLANPEKAVDDGVLATPTLLRVKPEPKKRVLGDLSDLNKILEELELITT